MSVDTELVGGVGTVIGAGAVAGWIRERRKGRRDANEFALALIDAQARRIDALMVEVGRLQGRLQQALDDNARLQTELGNHSARNAASAPPSP